MERDHLVHVLVGIVQMLVYTEDRHNWRRVLTRNITYSVSPECCLTGWVLPAFCVYFYHLVHVGAQQEIPFFPVPISQYPCSVCSLMRPVNSHLMLFVTLLRQRQFILPAHIWAMEGKQPIWGRSTVTGRTCKFHTEFPLKRDTAHSPAAPPC